MPAAASSFDKGLTFEGPRVSAGPPAAGGPPAPTFHVSIEDDADIGAEAVASDRGSDGLPAASVTVDAEGAFVRVSASRRGQERALAALLQVRTTVLRQMTGLEDVQCMPWEMQKAVTALVKDRWWHDNKPDIDKEAVMEEVSHRGSAEAHEGL